MSIIDAVVAGVGLRTGLVVEADRERAIGIAIEKAADGDLVLILGRGHEPMQDMAGEKIPFDDRRVARRALQRRRSAESERRSGSMTP